MCIGWRFDALRGRRGYTVNRFDVAVPRPAIRCTLVADEPGLPGAQDYAPPPAFAVVGFVTHHIGRGWG